MKHLPVRRTSSSDCQGCECLSFEREKEGSEFVRLVGPRASFSLGEGIKIARNLAKKQTTRGEDEEGEGENRWSIKLHRNKKRKKKWGKTSRKK